jgi:putative ABC transport system ATP-binding protein
MINIENLSKMYNGNGKNHLAIDDISYNFPEGKFISIVGASGAGKTTLLLCLGGLIQPTNGKVNIAQTSLYDISLEERAHFRLHNIGFIFQTFNLIPYMTALENVQIPLVLTKTPPLEQQNHAMELLNQFGLGDRLNHKPRELSVGEQQRVAIARALANNPKVILADEPTGNLDPTTTQKTAEYFKELSLSGITVVMVTHNPTVAEFGDIRLHLKNKKLEVL